MSDEEAVSIRARRAFAMVMGPGQTCLNLTRLEKRLREANVPYTGGAHPTHRSIRNGAYAVPIERGVESVRQEMDRKKLDLRRLSEELTRLEQEAANAA